VFFRSLMMSIIEEVSLMMAIHRRSFTYDGYHKRIFNSIGVISSVLNVIYTMFHSTDISKLFYKVSFKKETVVCRR